MLVIRGDNVDNVDDDDVNNEEVGEKLPANSKIAC